VGRRVLMANITINDMTELTSVDRAADFLEITDATDAGNSYKASVNSLLNVTSQPVGINDIQTLTNKTITAPTMSDLVLSGTITGVYTIGGTPTFPTTVTTLTGIQTLTNKTLTSPTINSATISNPTLTVNTISEYTAANGVVVDGVTLKDSNVTGTGLTLSGNATISGTLAVTGAVSTTGQLSVQGVTAPPASGAVTAGILMSSTANFGIFYGSGAPTFSAARGSLYLRTDGSSTSTRAYINTNASTTWTAITTVA
jgi:aspartate carbamoyltransferase regulatory subunit